ncbi:MAG: hypothetical protein DRP01_00880 [Archaeoglobales archaeon]|nr:MAG: hypothetical protein DRP01_00880 [Archaeoglobales archaeon]
MSEKMLPRLPYGKEYLDWWYNKGGMVATLLGLDSVGGASAVSDAIKKAIGPWDAPNSPYAEYFEPKFSATVQMWVERSTEVWKLLRKTTFLAEGDSLKYVESDLSSIQGVTGSSTPFASGTNESAPTVATLEEIEPAYLVDAWETTLPSRTRSTWQSEPKLDPKWIKQYHAELFPHQIDALLCRTIDTPNNDGSSVFFIESIDRICSGNAEASTTYVSDAADPDIHWGKSTALIDRSADTDDTFGCGAGDGLSLPDTGAARTLKLDYIDDVVAAIVPYSKNKRFIGITGPKTLNEMQKLIDPKQRYLNVPVDVQVTINGVSTRKGAKAGFTVGAYVASGIEIPFFTSRHIANETSANRSATITDADIGNIYIIDLDTIEIRTAVPVTYLETPPHAMLTGDMLKTRHMLMYGAQLICTNFRANGAVKYLKSS